MKQKAFNLAMAVVVAIAVVLSVMALSTSQTQFQTMALGGGVSNFTGLHVAAPTAMATATPGLMADCAGVNNCFEVRDGATPVAAWEDGGVLDVMGNQIDLDADGDTSITADTDDQIDVEIGGADIIVANEWGADTITSSTTEHLVEIIDTTNVMTGGTNVLSALNIDLGIGNSTAGTNSIYGILVDNISQDAQNTETAIALGGTGWDIGFDLAGNVLDLDADNDTSITVDTDDQIDVEIAGADDFRLTANTFTALAGSSIEVNTIQETSGTTITIGADVDVTGTIEFGSSNLTPLGYSKSGEQIVFGSSAITATTVIAHGLTTPTYALCTYSGTLTDNEEQLCSMAIAGAVVSAHAYKEDGSAADSAVTIFWMVVGTP